MPHYLPGVHCLVSFIHRGGANRHGELATNQEAGSSNLSGRTIAIIELYVRWYVTYRLSYRDLVAMMAERGVEV
jgi:hypothetical protein